jgi:hypothetical protein
MSEIDKSTCMQCRMTFHVGKPEAWCGRGDVEVVRCPEGRCGRTFWSGQMDLSGPIRCYVEHA